MANGYDAHSLKATGLDEASSSDMAKNGLAAVKDKRFTRTGIGYRTQQREASTLDPGVLGQAPPPIMYGDDYAGGTATRQRGMVNESKLPWQTAQEATTPQIKPRQALPPWGSDMNEALPPWLKDKGDETKEALPPWLQKKDGSDEEKESGVQENWMDGGYGDEDDEGPECEAFPDEEDAREALSTLAQFMDGNTVKAIQNQIVKQYGDPAEPDDSEDDLPVPAFPMAGLGESARLREAPLDAKKRNALDDSDFALPGRKYPIDTPERAKSALARVQQFGSDSDKSKVKSAVQKKYPDMKLD